MQMPSKLRAAPELQDGYVESSGEPEHRLAGTVDVLPRSAGTVAQLATSFDHESSSSSGARLRLLCKRAFDLVVATLALVALFPVALLAAICLVIDSPGPVFFRSERVGFRGRPLWMLKFRKMHRDASGSPLTMDDDDRFTRVGVWLARLKLDEIPQLWHVITGEMSLVGPRPEDPRFVGPHVDDYQQILRLRPGITGLSQIAFADESSILDEERPVEHYLDRILPQKLHLDKLYAKRAGVLLDLRILYWTAIVVLARRPVAVHRSSGAMNLRKPRTGKTSV